jgi:DNA-binding transcriptional LysR family regulator
MIELRHLRHLLALARHGNFSRAAVEVGLTQPALSRSIQSLESLVGAPLLARNRTGVEPTEMGRLVIRHAEAIDASARDLDRDIRLARGLEVGELHIGSGPIGGSLMLGAVVGVLARQHPNLRVRIASGPWDELAERLRRREIDVAVAEASIFARHADLEHQTLTERRLVIVCRPGHPLTQQADPKPGDIFKYPFAGPPMSDDASRTLLGHAPPEWLAANTSPGSPPNPVTIVSDIAAVLRDILMGSDAISVLPEAVARERSKDGTVVALGDMGLGLTSRLGVAWLATRSLSMSGRRLLELMIEADQRLGP